eukprot:m.14556 g.14556  ORF g.14556 m.14556 type:complete len:112 (+) comp5128_c0_seq1:30-365(+)
MSKNAKTPLLKAQNEVDEVVGIMRDNMEKVLERDHKVADLQDKSESLKVGAKRFTNTSTALKNRMWWKNAWWRIGCIVTLLLIIAAVVLGIMKPWEKKHNDDHTTAATTTN